MREVSPNEGGGPAAPTRETLKWIIDTCEMARRLERKIANARGFAVNNRDCLAAHPPSSGRRWPIPASQPPVILAKITGNASSNDYTAKSIRGAAPDTATYADTDFGDELAEEDDIIARDRAQIGGSTPRPLTGLIIAGKVIGRTDDGKRIVEFASAVQKLRIHGDQLQATYLPNPAGDSDWVDMVEGYDCDD